jgi:mevalonate kinase
MRRQRALENYEKLLIKFNATQNAKDRARILPVLRAQHESLTKAGVSIPELDALLLP